MKFCMFHLMPYRALPNDFQERYRSICVDVPSHLYDPLQGARMYNDTLDELIYADQMGLDGVCVNEHHSHMYVQSVYTNTRRQQAREWSWGDYVEAGNIIAGSPATVRDRLREAITKLHVGNLMVLLHIGSMPRELTLKNIQLFAEEVMPHLTDMWSDWENRWWIKPVAEMAPAAAPISTFSD